MSERVHGRKEVQNCMERCRAAADKDIAGSFVAVVAGLVPVSDTEGLSGFLRCPRQPEFLAVGSAQRIGALEPAAVAVGYSAALVEPWVDSWASIAPGSVDSVRGSFVKAAGFGQRLAVLVSDKLLDSVGELEHIHHLKREAIVLG